MKKIFKLSVFKISLVVTLFFLILTFIMDQPGPHLSFLKTIALKVNVDSKFRMRGKRPVGQDIVIVDVDDKSIEQFGRWPWNRRILGEGLQKIAQNHPKVIALDILFSEPDPNSQAPKFRALQNQYRSFHSKDSFFNILTQETQKADTDHFFSNTIKTVNEKTPVMLGYFFYFTKEDIQELKTDWEKEFEHIFDSKIKAKIATVPVPPEEIPTGLGARSSIEIYAKATPHHGFFDISSDMDGVIRKTHLIGKYKNTLFPSWALKTAALALEKHIVVQFDEFGIENIFFNKEPLPIDNQGIFQINYAGPAKTFPYYSFADVYNGDVKPLAFKDKIVLWGVSAKAVSDIRVSPYDSAHPGVEINATIVENLVHQNYLIRPNDALTWELLFILLMGIILGVVFTKVRSTTLSIITIILFILYIILDQKFLFEKGFLANIFMPSLHLIFTFITTNAFKYFIEEKRSREIKAAFQHYVSPAVVNEILKKPDELKLGGEKRVLTVLFSDIRSFTTLSEKTAPDKLTSLLNIYLTEMTNIVFEQRGMLDKYVGDELMAVYGAPLHTDTHPLDACTSAIIMMEKLKEVQGIWAKQGVVGPNIGIGMHTGEMVIGNMGSTTIFDYTVIGDSVNLGARLEGTNKEYKTNIITSEDTYNLVKDKITCRALDYIRVKGKHKPVPIYEVCGFTLSDTQKKTIDDFTKGLELYRKMQWAKAIEIFEKYPKDGPSQVFLERCKLYLQEPPPLDWDQVFVMKTK